MEKLYVTSVYIYEKISHYSKKGKSEKLPQNSQSSFMSTFAFPVSSSMFAFPVSCYSDLKKKKWPKTTREETLYLTSPSNSRSLRGVRNSRQKSGSRNWSRAHWRRLLMSLLPYVDLRTTCPEAAAQKTVGGALPHQPLIKKRPTDFPTGKSNGRNSPV